MMPYLLEKKCLTSMLKGNEIHENNSVVVYIVNVINFERM